MLTLLKAQIVIKKMMPYDRDVAYFANQYILNAETANRIGKMALSFLYRFPFLTFIVSIIKENVISPCKTVYHNINILEIIRNLKKTSLICTNRNDTLHMTKILVFSTLKV